MEKSSFFLKTRKRWMRQARGLAIALALTVMLGQTSSLAESVAQPARPPQVDARVWERTAGEADAPLLVILKEQADVSRAPTFSSTVQRRAWVYDTLRAVALRSQKSLRVWLDAQGVPYRTHYLVNMVSLQGDRALVLMLAQRPDVARLVLDPQVVGVERIAVAPRWLWPVRARNDAPTTPEWGVSFVHAPEVWGAGFTGAGIVIGVQDTGVDWQHPALQAHYRGWNDGSVSHTRNWHSAVGVTAACADATIPCDPYGHGTHVTGTAVGDDGAGNQIGVAPDAQWIGCRNMDDQGRGSPSTYSECFEFLLAPYPVNGDPQRDGDPTLAADVINNSWNCPPSEGCDSATLQQIVESVRAAGVMVVSSAGNNGSACGSVLYPIAIYDASYSVASVNADGVVSASSSRGPVTINGSNLSKPDISAPGVLVRSSYLGNTYRLLSGTSMAAPHVSGVVALLWSAYPSLIGQIDATEAVLNRTAQHVVNSTCGPANSPNYNHTYGWGYVDALAAIHSLRNAYFPLILRGG